MIVDHLEETVHYDGDEDGGFSYGSRLQSVRK